MPPKIIDVPGVGVVEFPETMPDSAIEAVLRTVPAAKTAPPAQPAPEMPFGEVATDMAGILIARPRTVDFAIIAAKLAGLEDACRRRDEAGALAAIADLVPELKRAGREPGKPQLKVVK